MAETGKRSDPYSAFRFHVEIGGLTYGWFRECSGLTSEIAIQANPQGGKAVAGQLPGRVKYTNIVLKWGWIDTSDAENLYQWHVNAIRGTVERRSGSILLLDTNYRTEKRRWKFTDAWPCKWEGPHFNAGSDDLAVVSLELAHEGIDLV
jgi:phage tail-like protein